MATTLFEWLKLTDHNNENERMFAYLSEAAKL